MDTKSVLILIFMCVVTVFSQVHSPGSIPRDSFDKDLYESVIDLEKCRSETDYMKWQNQMLLAKCEYLPLFNYKCSYANASFLELNSFLCSSSVCLILMKIIHFACTLRSEKCVYPCEPCFIRSPAYPYLRTRLLNRF